MKKLLIVTSIMLGMFTMSLAQNLTSVTSKKDFDKNINEEVELIGLYKTMMLPESARPDSPQKPSKRVYIELSDGSHIALETHDAGIRPVKEKVKLLNKKVKVTGTLHANHQLWGTNMEAAIVMDAIKDVKSVEATK
jgi:hypothetical protein